MGQLDQSALVRAPHRTKAGETRTAALHRKDGLAAGVLPPLPPVPLRNLRAKRVVDLAFGVPALLLAAPLLAAIWVAYKASALVLPRDRGPVLHKVYRHGGLRVIPLYKIRVSRFADLRAKAAALGPEAIHDMLRYLPEHESQLLARRPEFLVEDGGKTPTLVGAMLKAFYLDELPQIFNVVAGDMSLVGPRPLGFRAKRVRPDAQGRINCSGHLRDYRHRNLLPGGLTGYYQINKSVRAKRDYATFVLEGIDLDRDYYRFMLQATPRQVVKRDLWVVWRTFAVVARHEGV